MRRHRRFNFQHISRIQVSNRLSGEPLGYVADISIEGLRLLAAHPLAVGGCYELRLHVPEPDGGERQVDIVVICQWLCRNKEQGRFEMGFELDRPSKDFTRLVAQLIARR
ncbi:MAG: PilZ domain-containing protein [Xanthomonadaceae bacterium]|mgnify:CR=1 FL=1|nr:PilZ domain-containing protein [Xanthomonadaceae bacterium]